MPVPFHQTNFDRSNNDSDCSPLDFSSRSLFFSLLEPGWSLEFLDPRNDLGEFGRLFLGEFKMENVKLIFR